jgi:hypothetical protein
VVARAASVSGPALVFSGNSANALALSAGYLINPGDQVDTRGGGRVVIDLSDGSMVVVEPQSLIVIKDFRQAESLRELFEILVGKVRVKINHFGGRPNPYRMNSPTASLAVRGTEFSIEVGPAGETQVMVYEGAVEVTSLSDPSQTVLVEAGRGVLVQAGQDFHMLGAMGTPPLARLGAYDRRVLDVSGGAGEPANSVPAGGNTGDGNSGYHPHREGGAPRATTSAYDNYVAGLSDPSQVPFLFRFNAFPEAHLDSLENPAYATQFRSAEGRVFVLPTYGGGLNFDSAGVISRPYGSFPSNFSISPQISIFSPVGHSNFFVGGSLSASHLNNSSSTALSAGDSLASGQTTPETVIAGGSVSSFYSGSIVLARRMGATSLGVGLDSLHGNGSLSSTTVNADPDGDSGGLSVEQLVAASRISQTRFTAGLTRDFSQKAKLGVFYRYGWISATDQDLSHTVNGVPVSPGSTGSAGHSAEIGFRLRGTITPRLFYGATGSWLGVSLGGALAHSDPAADWPAPILALDAEIRLVSAHSDRTVPAAEFFQDAFTTAIEPGEIVLEVRAAVEDSSEGYRYEKVAHPASGFAVVGVAARIRRSGGKIAMARIGVTGMGPHAFRATGVEELLASGASAADAVKVLDEGQDANSDLYASGDYRRHLARVHAARAIAVALSRAS